MIKCPVCQLEQSTTKVPDTSTHAGDSKGHIYSSQQYKCLHCGGTFFVDIEYYYNEVIDLKIHYKAKK